MEQCANTRGKWLNGSCLQCSFCQQSDEPLCAKALLSGYTVDGTFQQYCIAKAAHIARIPKDCNLEAVAPVLCAGITVYKGLKESGARPGQTVAIVGAGGGLGSLACQYAKAMGLEIIAIDCGDEKKAMTARLGANKFVDFATSKDLVAETMAATEDGLGPHAVLLVAADEVPFQQAAAVGSVDRLQAYEPANKGIVRPSSWHCSSYGSPSWCLPSRPRFRCRSQDDHHQRLLRRQ
jgi:propanol-preferring alcohol dehydrogenase